MSKMCSQLKDRLATVSSERPSEIRRQVLQPMLEVVPAQAALFFTAATNDDREYFFTRRICEGHDTELINEWLAPAVEGPALDTPWLPPNVDPGTINQFIRVRTFFSDQYLLSFEVNQKLIWPAEIGDQLRVVLVDGEKLLGWLGLTRRGADERFTIDEERRLQRVVPQLRAALRAAEALESELFCDQICAVLTPRGELEHSSNAFKKWMSPERLAYLKRRTILADKRSEFAATELYSGSEIHLVRLDGSLGVRYMASVDRAELLRLDPAHRLTERQREVAQYAAAGATSHEIADTLDLSPHTVKTHLKNIYQRLGVSSRLELADVLRES